MIRIFLYPFSLLYGIAVFIRNRLYDLKILKSTEFEVPVISVGNITAGGTGKTPHIEYLIEILKDKYKVAVLSRGYGRLTKGFRMVESNSVETETGDESLQIKQKFPEIIVSVCENRVKGVQKLLEKSEFGPDVILLDDAFQHRRISPGINILLIDYNRPVSKDILLPAGRLREGIVQMKRANMIICTKCPSEVTPIMRNILKKEAELKPYQELFFTTFSYGPLKPVFPDFIQENDEIITKKIPLLVVTGIASPGPLYEELEKRGYPLEKLAFPDHRRFTTDDFQTIIRTFEKINSEKKYIITTAKDAVRMRDSKVLPSGLRSVLWYIDVKVTFLDNEEKHFNTRIFNYVGENKGNRELYHRQD